MPLGEIVSGQYRGWKLIDKLGEGDAGEVYQVESVVDQKTAILKRPHRSAFTTDILRQSSQIQAEGSLLRAIKGLIIQGPDYQVRVPGFLDQSKPGTEFSDRFFIVIENAQGIDLVSLKRGNIREEYPKRNGNPEVLAQSQSMNFTPQENQIISRIQQNGRLPDILLLRVLSGLLLFFEQIHSYQINQPEIEAFGILWNDVKPEHIFWQPVKSSFTIVDWGNAQLIDTGGSSKDRRYSIADDYLQFIQEMGHYLESVNPSLLSRLDWPRDLLPASIFSQGIKPLQLRMEDLLNEAHTSLRLIREEEESLIFTSKPNPSTWKDLIDLQDRLLRMGEMPDWVGAERLAFQLARELVITGERSAFIELCEQLPDLPGVNHQRWDLICEIAGITPWPGLFELPAQQALLAALADDWEEALWKLRLAAGRHSLPDWWPRLSDRIRSFQPDIGPGSITPLVSVNRVILTLQAESLKNKELQNDQVNMPVLTWSPLVFETPKPSPDIMARQLKEKVIQPWTAYEPDPPGSDITYLEVKGQLDELALILPEGKEQISKALSQPCAQVQVILDAWERQDFVTAQRGLRKLLMWDPDRQRVFLADQAISQTPGWLECVRRGPDKGESLQEFTTRCELHGREMHNQVGPALWLDQILKAFSRLRKGALPADVLMDYPELRTELTWLLAYQPPRLTTTEGPVHLERSSPTPLPDWTLQHSREGLLGDKGEMVLTEPQDTWIPEARGSSARVFLGLLNGEDYQTHSAAIKIMRPGKADYALPLFKEEAQILSMLRGVPGVNPLFELGFIQPSDLGLFPTDERATSAGGLQGKVIRLGVGEIQTFLGELETRTSQNWLPYLALQKLERDQCLMTMCDSGYTHGHFLSIKESLRLAIQILDTLHLAHARNIVYRDHKILHYYWLPEENGITVIDWNVSRWLPGGISNAERTADMVQFSARALHHIMTGRPAPGALPTGPTRPEEIEQAAKTYEVQWTFDDQRLPTRLKDIIQSALAAEFEQVSSLRHALEALFRDMPDGT